MDVDAKGSITKQEAITALSSGPNLEGTYDSVRTTLKEVQVDSSGQIELEDYIDLIAKLRMGRNKQAGKAVGSPGNTRVMVQGSNSNIQHGILPDELSAFTTHINSVRSLISFFSLHPHSKSRVISFWNTILFISPSLEMPISDNDFPCPQTLSRYSMRPATVSSYVN
jgi:hypothetical protein